MIFITDKLQEACNLVFRFIPQAKPSSERLKAVKLVAHRGCWNLTDRKENTLPAFDHCLGKNIWAIEFDIRWTSDDIPVVHHDALTLRVFGRDQKINELTFDQLQDQFPDIPSLEEVIERYRGKLHFMIELKTEATQSQSLKLKDILAGLEPIRDFHFMSLQFSYFKPLENFPKKSFVSIARTNIRTIFDQSIEEDIGGLTGQYLLVTNGMKKACDDKNIHVGTGFPDSKNLLFREINRDVAWIFTNKADEFSKYLNS